MIAPGARVEHAEFGIGQVTAVLGATATVEFFGESIDVDLGDLMVREDAERPHPVTNSKQTTNLAFRHSFEAVNLGVVPTDPDQLVKLTIGGREVSEEILEVLRGAPKRGASRIFMGYYGTGKSHHLRLVRSIALKEGWVVASLELDPKSADPAKPSTVYRELLSSLEFPMRADGSRSQDFLDLVKEIRDHWSAVRALPYLQKAPSLMNGLEAIQYLAHRRDDPEYVAAVSWLAGQVAQVSAIRSHAFRAGYRGSIPKMPKIKDNGLIYVYQLVVIHHVLKALGYRGLAVLIDEAEHVRSYSVNRYLRANNFFDLLARSAHPPRKNLSDPTCDYDVSTMPPFWKEGPHFSLFVGLTEGEDTQDLTRKAGEMSVLIHSRDEVVQLHAPSPEDYEKWVESFLAEASDHLGPKVALLRSPGLRAEIAAALRHHFEQTPAPERILRNWTKLAGFAAAVLMSKPRPVLEADLVAIVDDAARAVAGEELPWDD